jgi:Flp pilus assembly protein TadD
MHREILMSRAALTYSGSDSRVWRLPRTAATREGPLGARAIRVNIVRFREVETMSRPAAVFLGIFGAFVFGATLAVAYRTSILAHLTRPEQIVGGVIAAIGFVIMMRAFTASPGAAVIVAEAVTLMAIVMCYRVVASSSAGNPRRYSQQTPADPKALFDQATAVYRADRFGDAIPLFEQYLRTNPNDALANARIGICLGQLERLPESMPYLKKASALDPTDYQSRSNLGLVYEKLGRPEEGIDWERQADRIKPNDAAVLNNLGWVLLRSRHYDEAIPILERAVRLAPNENRYRVNLKEARKAKR